MKRKSPQGFFSSTACIEESGELEGMKSLFEVILTFSDRGDLQRTTRALNFNGRVNYIFDFGFTS